MQFSRKFLLKELTLYQLIKIRKLKKEGKIREVRIC